MPARAKSPQGGIFVTKRIKALRKLGVNVIPIALNLKYSKILSFLQKQRGFSGYSDIIKSQEGVEYEVVDIPYTFIKAIRCNNHSELYEKLVYKKVSSLDYKKIDIIHLHWFWPYGLAIKKIAKEYKIPYVITCHGSEINVLMKNQKYRKKMLNILENASLVEFVSTALKDKAIEFGYSGKNGIVNHNGIDTDIFYLKRVTKEKPVIGYVGNMISIKGADRLPNIFRGIYESYGNEVNFVMVGQGDLSATILEKMKGLPVDYKGQIDQKELASVYNSMDVLVVPSRSEGYPCVVNEAQACGVLVVGNDVGGVKEAIGDLGIVVSGDSEEEICSRIVEKTVDIISKDNNIKELADKALQFSWYNYQKDTIKYYNSIISN